MNSIEKEVKVELLVPIQNKKSINAIKDYADAIYFGTESLNMRMNADNVSLALIDDLVQYAHSFQLKTYLTTNVIIYENEIKYLRKVLEAAKNANIDAVIVHDLASIELARELSIPFHISTQASISNSIAAKFYEKLGAERIILARECSLSQIKNIALKLNKAKIETFIHGAQCTSISGRCYFSTFINDDPICSANRGKCLQPCRHKWKIIHQNGSEMDYHEGFFLNSKDLCMIEYIPELINAHISSFKIEGRMRDPHYLEVVAKCYREAIDSYYEGNFSQDKIKIWLTQLERVYNRGFSKGFYFGKPGAEDIASEKSGNQATTKKIQIGKVISYYRNVKVAKIQLNAHILKLGDEIIFEGAKLGTFHKQIISSMQIKMKSITETPFITQGKSILLSISVDEPVKKGDWIYKYQSKL